jgi:hypothetical protein
MVIALAFSQRIFTRSLPMNQAHAPIISEAYRLCWVRTNTPFQREFEPSVESTETPPPARMNGSPDHRQPGGRSLRFRKTG